MRQVRTASMRLSGSALALASAGVLIGASGPPKRSAKPAPLPAGKVLVRHRFAEGRELTYRLQVESDADWQPRRKGLDRGSVDTDFTFRLTAKAIRQNGACTFGLTGERLESKVTGPNGTASIDANDSRFRIRSHGRNAKLKTNPLTEPMTVTVGPRGKIVGGTGLARMIPFLAAGVGHSFLNIVILAPEQEVGVGDTWEGTLPIRLPDSVGQELSVSARADVTGWKTVKRRRCLGLKAEATAKLDDTTVTLRNGDRLAVNHGSYTAKGTAMWDVERGLLCRAEVDVALSVDAKRPVRSRLTAKTVATLELVSAK